MAGSLSTRCHCALRLRRLGRAVAGGHLATADKQVGTHARVTSAIPLTGQGRKASVFGSRRAEIQDRVWAPAGSGQQMAGCVGAERQARSASGAMLDQRASRVSAAGRFPTCLWPRRIPGPTVWLPQQARHRKSVCNREGSSSAGHQLHGPPASPRPGSRRAPPPRGHRRGGRPGPTRWPAPPQSTGRYP